MSENPPAPTYADRVLGCLLGGAVGDAFGYEIEFDSLNRIRQRFGRKGLQEPVRHGGKLIVSDDTQMTLFTLEGLLRARSAGCLLDLDATLEHIRLATLDWYKTQSPAPAREQYTGRLGRSRVMQARRAPGNTCLSACAKGATGTSGSPINDSKGCGGVMRVAPIGLMREYTVAKAFELGARAAAQTHGHPEGYLPAGVMAAMVRGLVEGMGLEEALAEALTALRGWERFERTNAVMVSAQGAGVDDVLASVRGLGKGWVGEEALAIGYYAARVGDGFAAAIRIGANHDGDSDSTASIAGQIVGAALGVGVIPGAGREGVDCGEDLLEMASELAS